MAQQVFDEFFMMPKGNISYPYVCIENASDELVVLIRGLEEGTLPVLVPFKGKLVEVFKMRKSPQILARLLKLYPLLIALNPNQLMRVKNVQELLDLEELDWNI